MTEAHLPVPFDFKVKFADIGSMRFRLTSIPWGDRESGHFLFQALRSYAGGTEQASKAYAAIRNAIGEWEKSIPFGLGVQFSGDKGPGRERRLIEILMESSPYAIAMMNFSRDFHASQTQVFNQIYSDLSIS